MLYHYKASTKEGVVQEGSIDAGNIDLAIGSIQSRGLTIVTIAPAAESKGFLHKSFRLSHSVPNKDVVIMSRQLATLFEAKVAVLSIFKLLALESENENLRDILAALVDDVQSGITISAAMAKHPQAFSPFYVNMVKAGEETGKLSESFTFLAEYLERSYEISSKVKNALLYPAFVIVSFVVVIVIMLVVVIPKLSVILIQTGQDLPLYTRIVINSSSILVNYGIPILVLLALCALGLWRFTATKEGKILWTRVRLATPAVGGLYRKLYMSRIADNMDTMLSSGIPMLRALEISSAVVDNVVYEQVLLNAMEMVKSGYALSDAFSRHSEIPRIIVEMTKIGEETGKLGYVLKTIARFYKREVDNAIDSIVSLIEPVMIVVLGLGVGFLLISILGPIYNIAGSF